MSIRFAISAIALLSSTTALSQVAVHVNPTAEHPVITFSISESVTSNPDIATVGVGVQTTALTPSEALRANSVKMEKVIAALKQKGIPERDIQTSGLNIQPQYDYNNQQPGKPPTFLGYQVSNQVTVISRDLPKLGALLDATVAVGGNSINGPNFGVSDNSKLLAESRNRGITSAERHAQDYAKRAGFVRARLLSITEGGGYSQPLNQIIVTASYSGSSPPPPPPPPPPMAPGQMSTAMQLTFQYQMEK